MDHQHDFIVSPSLLCQFDSKFAESGVITTGLELEDFIEHADKPLRTLCDTNTNSIGGSRSNKIGDELLTVSQEIEDRQPQSPLDSMMTSMALPSTQDHPEDADINMLLSAASQQILLGPLRFGKSGQFSD